MAIKDNLRRPTLKTAHERFSWLATQPLRTTTAEIGFLKGTVTSWQDVYEHRNLWQLLTKRELKARYKDSTFGYLWTLIRPIVSLLIYYLAIGRVLGAERAIPDFAVYVFAGLTGWTFFATAISGATASILANSGVVKKVYLPRELFPLTSVTSAIVDLMSQLMILVCGAIIIRGVDALSVIIYAPLSLAVILVWATALGLVLSAANVYFRDVQYLVEVAIMIGFWLTPCVYSFQMIEQTLPAALIQIYLLNPTALAVMGMQKAFWIQGVTALWPDHLFTRLVIMLLVGILLIVVGQRVFAHLQRNFAQEL